MFAKNKLAYLKYFAALLLFGSNGIVASRIALNSWEIVFTRTLTGSLFLALVFVLSRQKLQFWERKSHFIFLLISGVAMGFSWMFLYEAYARVGVGLATLAYYCGPVLVLVLSPLLFREKIAGAALIGFAAVTAGMLCVNGQALLRGSGASWGLLLGILSAVMYALMVIFNKKALSITGLENPLLQLVISFLTVALYMAARQGFIIRPAAGSWAPILLLGVVNTGIGCYFYFSSIGSLPVQTVAVGGYIEPLSALLFSAALLGEKLTLLQIAGAVLILGGAAFAEVFRSSGLRLR